MKSDELSILGCKVSAREFDLCRGQEFISIRDQAVRVRTLLWSMDEAGYFDTLLPWDKVLVVGAGYAGASASLWLADRGINTVLVDTQKEPFSLQAECTSRWLSLTQYDWPAPHYPDHNYPQGLHPDRFGYAWLQNNQGFCRIHANGLQRASDHAADWTKEFKEHLKRLGGKIDWRPEWEFRGCNVPANPSPIEPFEAEFERLDGIPLPSDPELFMYVFHAEGFGNDAVRLGVKGQKARPRTKSFWDKDGLSETGVTPPKRVLISGGGDGAIQDALRALVDPKFRTPIEMLVHVHDTAKNAARARLSKDPTAEIRFERDWAHFEHAISFAEEQATKAYSWMGTRPDPIWSEVHERFERALQCLAKDHGQAMLQAMEDILARTDHVEELYVVHTNVALKKCFPLNRVTYMLCVETFRCRGGNGRPTYFGANVTCGVKPLPTAFHDLAGCRIQSESCSYDATSNTYTAVWTDAKANEHKREVDLLFIRNGPKPAPVNVQLVATPVQNAPGRDARIPLGRFRLPYVAIA